MPLPGRNEAPEMDARSQKWTQMQGWDKGPEVDSWAKIGCSARGRIEKYDEKAKVTKERISPDRFSGRYVFRAKVAEI